MTELRSFQIMQLEAKQLSLCAAVLISLSRKLKAEVHWRDLEIQPNAKFINVGTVHRTFMYSLQQLYLKREKHIHSIMAISGFPPSHDSGDH